MGEIDENPEQQVPADQSEVSDVVDETESASPSADTEPTEAAESDDIAVALSDAEDKAGAPDSLDDIVPETTHVVPEAAVALPASVRPAGVPWWPFLAYLGAWVVLTGLAVWQLLQLPTEQVAYESQAYGLMVLGGLIMTAVGPLLILSVWFAVWSGRSPGERSGLLTSALLKGAVATLGGAVFWWAALIAVDSVRLGSPL